MNIGYHSEGHFPRAGSLRWIVRQLVRSLSPKHSLQLNSFILEFLESVYGGKWVEERAWRLPAELSCAAGSVLYSNTEMKITSYKLRYMNIQNICMDSTA